jgi:hypothetical protein
MTRTILSAIGDRLMDQKAAQEKTLLDTTKALAILEGVRTALEEENATNAKGTASRSKLRFNRETRCLEVLPREVT